MFYQLKNIIKIVRPKHILKSVLSPLQTIETFKYHYRRVSEREFVEFLSQKWHCTSEIIDSAYQNLSSHQEFWKEIHNRLSVYPDGYGLQMTKELPALYLLVRLIKPDVIIETGVSAGTSSTYILRALKDNGKGKLYSIDLPPDNIPEGRSAGWVVPEDLRDRWELLIGDSKKMLTPLLSRLCKIDCFIHDSLHTYEHMMWEFKTIWEHLRPGSFLLSHDVGANRSFFDFMNETGVSWKEYRVYHVLGGFQKPITSIGH